MGISDVVRPSRRRVGDRGRDRAYPPLKPFPDMKAMPRDASSTACQIGPERRFVRRLGKVG